MKSYVSLSPHSRRPRFTSIPVTYIFAGHSHCLSSTSFLNHSPDHDVHRVPHLSLKSYRSRSSCFVRPYRTRIPVMKPVGQ